MTSLTTVLGSAFALLWLGAALGGAIPRVGTAFANVSRWVLAFVSPVLLVLFLPDDGFSTIAGAVIGGGLILFGSGAIAALRDRPNWLKIWFGAACILNGFAMWQLYKIHVEILIISFVLGVSIFNRVLWSAWPKNPATP